MASLTQIKSLPEDFFERDPESVAKDLLGKRLIRRLGDDSLEGTIVETEAYFGLSDPASRAYHGVKKYNRLMWKEPGRVFIYNVHRYWMLNVVAHELGKIGAVLIRAIEPTKGVEIMKRNRKAHGILELTSGPGKLSQALRIDKSLNGVNIALGDEEILILDNEMSFEIESSHRIGVKRDLQKKLRFFIKGNKFVSR